MASSLHLGKTKAGRFTLPAEAVTQTFGILAMRGAGKTYCARVMVEGLHGAGLPVVVVDPIGVCWGLRAGADGKRAGLAIIVLGGDHGDVPLESTAGAVIADFVVEHRSSCVLDLSRMRKAEQVRFMTAFAERLYYKNREPLHLVIDEADAFAPQRPMAGQQRLLGAIEDLVRRGRARGLGITLVTQRAAVLNKNVLTQIDTLIVLRTVSPQDRKAMEDWIKSHDAHGRREAFMESLPALGIGEAWVWSPGWLDCFERVKVREARTFDSSATPKVGARRVEPQKMAAVDLQALEGRIAETIERAKADDPAALHRRIRELERNAETPKRQNAKTEEIEKAVAAAVAKVERRSVNREEGYQKAMDAMRERIRRARELLSENGLSKTRNTKPRMGSAVVASEPAQNIPEMIPSQASRSQQVEEAPPSDGRRLGKAERAILAAIASRRPRPMKARAVALIAGYSPKSGSYRNSLSMLRTAGLIAGGREDLRLTDAGEAFDNHDPVLTGPALLDHWLARLHKAERTILEAVAGAHPHALTKDEIAEQTEYSPTSGSFRNALSRLRTAELITGYDEIEAAETLFE